MTDEQDFDEGNLLEGVNKLRRSTDTLAGSIGDLASKTDLADSVKIIKTQNDLDRMKVKTYGISAMVVAIAIIGATFFGVIGYTTARDDANDKYVAVAANVCRERGAQSDAMRTFFAAWETNVMSEPMLSKEYKAKMRLVYAEQAKAFVPIDCSVLEKALATSLASNPVNPVALR